MTVRRRLRRIRRPASRPAKALRRHVRRVALVATAATCAVYFAAAGVGDLLVVAHVKDGVDARLARHLAALNRSVQQSGSLPTKATASRALRGAPPAGSGDVDGAPIFSWWIPKPSGKVVPLERVEPRLGKVPTGASVLNATVAGRAFRLHEATLAKGTLLVGTSVAAVSALRTNLIVLEAALLPVVLALIYLVATVIGRGAATPVEQARREHLDFTADASHELRTPLAVIEAEVGLTLMSTRSASSYRSSLERISVETKRLRGVVDDLLWLARVDALPDPPERELVDLGALAQQAARRFAPIASGRSLALSCSAGGPDGPFVHAPADWLDRLVSVLLDNACRYADTGGAIDVIATADGRRSVLLVDDTGPGIDAGQLDEVVRRFHRASPTPGGAGLGLSIAEAIVRATGATWRIGRAPAGGTRVEVSWPSAHRTAPPSDGEAGHDAFPERGATGRAPAGPAERH